MVRDHSLKLQYKQQDLVMGTSPIAVLTHQKAYLSTVRSFIFSLYLTATGARALIQNADSFIRFQCIPHLNKWKGLIGGLSPPL
jgi:hypothetical protein